MVRQVVDALQQGVQLRDIAVLYSGDRAYQALIPQSFAAANIPVASMPGTPLDETAMGRGVLSLARLPLQDYSRGALFDFLSLAPVREWLPTRDGTARLQASQWLRLAREAGITHGLDRWHDALELFEEDRRQGLAPENDLSEARRNRYEADLRAATQLGGVVQRLADRLEPLRRRQRAGTFVPTFLALLDDYLRADAQGISEVRAEVEQLGTVDSIGGARPRRGRRAVPCRRRQPDLRDARRARPDQPPDGSRRSDRRHRRGVNASQSRLRLFRRGVRRAQTWRPYVQLPGTRPGKS